MDSFVNQFMYDGKVADDFFYVVDVRGRRRYYVRRTNKSTSTQRIPPGVKEKVTQKLNLVSKVALLRHREAVVKQIQKLQDEVESMDKTLSDETFDGTEEEQEREEAKLRECQDRYERDKRSRERIFDGIRNGARAPSPTPTDNKEPTKEPDPLAALKIVTRKDWLRWLTVNHPDKGGNRSSQCAAVITAGRAQGW